MKIAFTMDDLPLWPMSYPPAGYTAEGIVTSIRSALQEHGITGVYAFCHSSPLLKHPEFAKISDDWVADGRPLLKFPERQMETHARIVEMAKGQNG